MTDEKLTPEELAKELKCSTKTLARYRRLRVGPPYVKVVHHILYLRSEVDEWLRKNQVNPIDKG